MNLPLPQSPHVSIVIITRDRPGILGDCLENLAAQTYRDFETIVVDSSSDEATAGVLAAWQNVRRIRICGARNNMPQARNAGIAIARGEVVAFIDDDSMASAEWLAQLVAGYTSCDIGGVGGRSIDPHLLEPGETRVGVVAGDGSLIRNFAAGPDEPVDVDWMAGGNMSFTRAALGEAGDFDRRYTGDNSFEEVDYAIRVRQHGYALRFMPRASVVHLAAGRGPGQVGRDHLHPRTRFYKARNETYFCLKNLGWRRPILRRLLAETLGTTIYTLRHLDGRLLAGLVGVLAGHCAGVAAWAGWRLRSRVLGGGD